jgi:hypothetical protein
VWQSKVVSTQTVRELSFEPSWRAALRRSRELHGFYRSTRRRGTGALGRSPSCPPKTADSEIRPYLFDTKISLWFVRR